MKAINTIRHFFTLATLLLGLFSCQKEELDMKENNDAKIEMVEVSLKLSETGLLPGIVTTKSIDEPAETVVTPADGSHIRNLCIYQFRGTDDSAPLVGEPQYLSADADPSDENYLNFSKIRLADSKESDHTLIFIANTFMKLPSVATLADLKSIVKKISSEQDMFGYDESIRDENNTFPNDRTYYQRMNGVVVTKISSGMKISASLARSMSRIKAKITNSGKENLVLKTIQIRNIPKGDHYFSNFTDFVDKYNLIDSRRFDYPAISLNDPVDGEQSQEFTWYVPANLRGIDSSNNLEVLKNRCKNSEGATFIQITGTYGPENNQPIAYTFYLGENLINDFNIKPNKSYSYNFDFNGKGNPSADDRIEDMGSYDFMVDANCYMLKTPSTGSRSFTFNVVHRPNIFWGTSSETENNRYGLYDEFENNHIPAGEGWKARILWTDFPMTKEQAQAFLSNNSGTNDGEYSSMKQRVTITIPAGLEGNAVIGVYRATDTEDYILWSWHLWITSYSPDDIQGTKPDKDKYIYKVKEGEVHRYGGAMWTTGGIYETGFAMDRNIGALDQKYHGSNPGGGLYYQFGRKDPFSAGYTIYSYDFEGNPTAVAEASKPRINIDKTGTSNYNNVPYSINNPMTTIIGKDYWTYNDIFNPTTYTSIIWNDPNINVKDGAYLQITDVEETRFITQKNTMRKSFFDPCPPGWIMPKYNWYSDFSFKKNYFWDIESTNGYNRGKGSTYYPNGKTDETQTIFFPACGYRHGTLGTMGNIGGWCWYWSYTSRSYYTGNNLIINSDGFLGQYNHTTQRSYAGQIRCVTE